MTCAAYAVHLNPKSDDSFSIVVLVYTQLELLGLGMGLSGELEQGLLRRYAHDATCIRFPPVRGSVEDCTLLF
jgi:hypothetical protein